MSIPEIDPKVQADLYALKNLADNQTQPQQPRQQNARQQQPAGAKTQLDFLIEGFTTSANAVIDYIDHSCTSAKAFDELLSRHGELFAQIAMEYRRIKFNG